MINLSQKIASIFYPVHKAIRDETHNEFWLKGGRNSTKSSFVALQIVLGIIDDPEANAVIFRKVGSSIKDSVKEKILWAIRELDQKENFHSIKSPHEITYIPTGQIILFKGLDEPTKSKSLTTEKGYFKFLWFEEGEEYNGDGEIRSVEESVLRGKKYFEFITYNPPKNPKHWINKLCEFYEKEKANNKFIHHSTYLDIPPEWVSSKTLSIANRLKENDYESYSHEYLGKPIGNPKEIIFSGKVVSQEFETPPLSELYQERFYFGADWGFANDPTTLIRMFIKDDCLYIDYEVYEKEVEIDHIGKVIFAEIPESKKWQIWADSSRPETISNVKRQGYEIEGAAKWKGSIEDGVSYLRSFKKIIVHTRCPRILREFETYSYKTDKESKRVLPDVDDKKSRIFEGDRS